MNPKVPMETYTRHRIQGEETYSQLIYFFKGFGITSIPGKGGWRSVIPYLQYSSLFI